MPKTKHVRVAVEGATSDGRTIERSWIEQMAANYNTAKYQARVWMEHMRGYLPDSPFRAFGDVLSLSTEEVDLGDGKKKLALLAQIDATDDLVNFVKARQKLFTSIEVQPKFADSGEAYLVGLAVTDSPASLGTEMLQFNATSDSHPLNARKQHADNLFTEAAEATIEFEDGEDVGLVATIKRLFSSQEDVSEKHSNDLAVLREILESYHAQMSGAMQILAAHVESMTGDHAKVMGMQEAFGVTMEELKQLLSTETEHQASTPETSYTQRTPATGGTVETETAGF